jgi:hypothetical protein
MSCGKDSRTRYEILTGNTPDISKWLDLEFYDLVWWIGWPNRPNVNDSTKQLGKDGLVYCIMLDQICVIGSLLIVDRLYQKHQSNM